MSFIGDTGPPTKSPFTDEWQEWISNLASDVSTLLKYKPLLDGMADTMGGTSGPGANVFPATITDNDPSYRFAELDNILGPVMEDGREGVCANALSYGVNAGGEFYVPPGFTSECFDDVFVEPGAGFLFSILKIAVGTRVHMLETPVGKEMSYSFCVPLPVCVSCGSGG